MHFLFRGLPPLLCVVQLVISPSPSPSTLYTSYELFLSWASSFALTSLSFPSPSFILNYPRGVWTFLKKERLCLVSDKKKMRMVTYNCNSTQSHWIILEWPSPTVLECTFDCWNPNHPWNYLIILSSIKKLGFRAVDLVKVTQLISDKFQIKSRMSDSEE